MHAIVDYCGGVVSLINSYLAYTFFIIPLRILQ